MKIYKTQKEVEADIVNGVLKIDDDVTFECDIDIDADIDAWDINAKDISAWNINAYDIKALDINALDIKVGDINAGGIDVESIKADDINAYDIKANDISYYAFCTTYESITCTSWKARRYTAHPPICLDGTLTIKEKEVEEVTMEEVCEKFGREVKIKK